MAAAAAAAPIAAPPAAEPEPKTETASSAPESEPEAPSALPEPLPPPTADPADPLQLRALAAGLHPRLSRVLLQRLSKADYANAEVAIRTAIAQTPEAGVHIWPTQRRPGVALFRIHFVQGAAPTCRRYVVTVIRDGWSTTAPPMERCGVTGEPSRRTETARRRI